MPIAANADDRLQAYVAEVAAMLDKRMQQALQQIEGTDRKLLALRSYVRLREPPSERWSWTQRQIVSYYRSDDYVEVLRELDKIKARFEQANPGYTLHVNTDVRSLDVQLERWNENPTVSLAAKQISRDAARELDKSVYGSPPTDDAVNAFVTFLKRWYPQSPPSLAAPGLSRHGRALAFDFHVQQGSKLVASTQMSAVKPVWDGEGWTEKLKKAVHEASDRFVGPLEQPREPWHYEYEGR